MTKISKTKARKMYNNNEEVLIVPNKINPNYGSFGLVGFISNPACKGMDFDKLVNAFEYYNCNSETGRHAAFYVGL